MKNELSSLTVEELKTERFYLELRTSQYPPNSEALKKENRRLGMIEAEILRRSA